MLFLLLMLFSVVRSVCRCMGTLDHYLPHHVACCVAGACPLTHRPHPTPPHPLTNRLLCGDIGCPACTLTGGNSATAQLIAAGGAYAALRLRDSALLVARLGRQTACQSPYRDAHGEDWTTSAWGRPLELHVDAYAAINQLVLGGGADFDAFMLHSAVLLAP